MLDAYDLRLRAGRAVLVLQRPFLDVELEASNLYEQSRVGLSWPVEVEVVDHDRRVE